MTEMATEGSTPRLVLHSMRPAQWLKSTVVFAPTVYGGLIADPAALLRSGRTAAAFCLMASAVYLVNDWIDRPRDRLHPERRHRPLASGALSPTVALVVAAGLALAALALGATVHWAVVLLLGAYLAVMVAYSARLKAVVILDVMVIAAGFLLRVAAGGVAVDVAPSSWLVLCSLLLALFLGFCKRRSELVLMDAEASGSRPSLEEYSLPLLDQMIGVVTASTLMAYAIYAVSAATAVHGAWGMEWTIPFVVYGIFRYLYLVYRRDGGANPVRTFLSDRALRVNVVLWIGVSLLLIYR